MDNYNWTLRSLYCWFFRCGFIMRADNTSSRNWWPHSSKCSSCWRLRDPDYAKGRDLEWRR